MVAAVAARPDLVRSWVCDILGDFHPDYQWHDFARFMQLPDANEAMSDQIGATTRVISDQGHWWMLSDPEGGAAMLEEFLATLA